MKAWKQHTVDYAGYLALRLVVAGLQAAPLSGCERFVCWLAKLVGVRLGLRRKVVDENLRAAFPDWTDEQLDRSVEAMWRHLFLMVVEIAHTPRKIHRTNWRQRYPVPEVEQIVSTLMSDRPKVIISGHFGNFELGGYMLGLFGFPTYTVARPIDNPYIDRYVNAFRGRTGQFMLPKEGSRDKIEQVLAGGGILTLLGDQAAGDKACWVEFFGRPASTHKAVSIFTLSYDAPTMVMASIRSGDPLEYRGVLAGVVDPRDDDFNLGTIADLTQWFTDQLESLIRQSPEQYWWVHRRWKGDPPPRVLKRMQQSADARSQVVDHAKGPAAKAS